RNRREDPRRFRRGQAARAGRRSGEARHLGGRAAPGAHRLPGLVADRQAGEGPRFGGGTLAPEVRLDRGDARGIPYRVIPPGSGNPDAWLSTPARRSLRRADGPIPTGSATRPATPTHGRPAPIRPCAGCNSPAPASIAFRTCRGATRCTWRNWASTESSRVVAARLPPAATGHGGPGRTRGREQFDPPARGGIVERVGTSHSAPKRNRT